LESPFKTRSSRGVVFLTPELVGYLLPALDICDRFVTDAATLNGVRNVRPFQKIAPPGRPIL
jgi:hypothetical protein